MGSRVDRYKKLGIPRRFQIHGHEVRVKILTDVSWRRLKLPKDAVGIFDPTSHVIALRNELGDTELGHAFCHEFTHALLDAMNHKLSFNEVFVDNFGAILHQALQTFTTATR